MLNVSRPQLNDTNLDPAFYLHGDYSSYQHEAGGVKDADYLIKVWGDAATDN